MVTVTNIVAFGEKHPHVTEVGGDEPAILWDAFISFTNDILQYNDYNTVCTSQQLKDYLKYYGKDYSIFEPLYAEVERIKAEF